MLIALKKNQNNMVKHPPPLPFPLYNIHNNPTPKSMMDIKNIC